MGEADRPRGFIRALETRHVGRILLLYGLLGIVAGLAAVLFVSLVGFAGRTFLGSVVHGRVGPEILIAAPVGIQWLVVLLPAIGGAISGLLCARLGPEAMGSGVNQTIDAYHRRGGTVRTRVPALKAIASAVTLGSGGSGGVEGPIGQICGGIGSVVAARLGLPARERRVFLMAGFAAGIGAVFHAPMAAAILSAEVLYADMDLEHEVLVPSIIASTAAYAVFGAVLGWAPMFELPQGVGFGDAAQLLPYLVLAVVLAVSGAAFVHLLRLVRGQLGRRASIPLWLRPAIGGLLVGLIGLCLPQVLGHGYGIVQTAMDENVPAIILVVLAAAKAIASALTTASGGASGLFAPSLVIGGALGGAVGIVADHVAPGLGITPAAFVVVGMGGFFAGVANAPLSTVIMVAEIVGSYQLIVPTLWVCAIVWLLMRRSHLFEEQAHTRLDAPGQLADMMGAVLYRIRVSDAMGKDPATSMPELPATVHPDTPLRELVRLFAETIQTVFPIVGHGDGRLLGVVDGKRLRRTVAEKGIDTLLIAHDFQIPAVTVTSSDTLHDAIGRMMGSGTDELIVVDEADSRRLVGLISRREVITAYHRRMLERAPEPPAPEAPRPPDEQSAAGEDGAGVEADEPALAKAMQLGGVVSGIDGRSPAQVLNQLVQRARLPADCDRGQLLALMLERESLGSTGVGDGLAVPHPSSEDLVGIRKPRVVIAQLTSPVDWGAFDGRPVETVCVLLAPGADTHLALLGDLARCLADSDVRNLLRRRASPKQLLAAVGRVLEQGKPGATRAGAPPPAP